MQSGGFARSERSAVSRRRSSLAVEHYGRIARTLEKNIPVTLQMDIDNKFYDDDLNAFNIVGELPGTDKADEVVMLGAHFDSWHTGTGATDNAAGSAVMMEAMRILKASGVKLRRTVRIGLWGGEEQGLLGSKEYVKAHFGDPATMQLKPEHAKFAGYFNVDNGTGLIRGVYLQGNEAVAPIFQAWMEPFKNLGMTTLTIRNTGGTDHLSYDAVGLPGFQFIQDEVEYDSRTHHSNMDVYERVQANDMMRNAVIVASFVLQHREPRREAAAEAAAEAGGAGGERRRSSNDERSRAELAEIAEQSFCSASSAGSAVTIVRIVQTRRAADLFARAPRGLRSSVIDRPRQAVASSCRR